jgi:hypothetical protein
MAAAVFALLGALLSPQDLEASLTPTSFSNLSLDAGALSNVTIDVGGSVTSQTLSATVSQVTIRNVATQGTISTGNITLDGSAAGMTAGIQAMSLNTGLGSNSQATISIAGGISFGKPN